MSTTTSVVPAIDELAASWQRSLRAANKSPKTLITYAEGVEQFAAFARERGMPLAVEAIHREHVEEFLADLFRRGHRPARLRLIRSPVARRWRSRGRSDETGRVAVRAMLQPYDESAAD